MAKEITSKAGLKLVRIPAGEFMQGAPDSDPAARDHEKPEHKVRITKDFYLGIYEVTQGQWKEVMGTEPWKGRELGKEGADFPAIYVNYPKAQEFCEKLSERDGRTYRLPTESEWEYACRAGTTTLFSFGDDDSSLGEFAWYSGNTDSIEEHFIHEVGKKKPNPWGLFDMHGNVREICLDGYDDAAYASRAGKVKDDPQGPKWGNASLLVRGGCFPRDGRDSRSSNRDLDISSRFDEYTGFRVLAVPNGN